jgi:MFS transporter, FSR family, fosmidomycin resistance protein
MFGMTGREHPPRPWHRSGLWAVVGSHTLADFYVGGVEATLPYFVTRAHYSYADIAGLSLAMTGAASISQPGFGWLADKFRIRWAVPVCIAITALCMSLSTARPDSYPFVWVMIALAGLASAGYHPPATIMIRDIAPGSNIVMSVFASAGNLGVALGPLAVVAIVGPLGLSATSWLILPGIIGLALFFLVGRRDEVTRRAAPTPRAMPVLIDAAGQVIDVAALDSVDPDRQASQQQAPNRWGWFGLLMASMTVWQVCFIATSTFIGVFLIGEFGMNERSASLPLVLLPAAGAGGTLLGGWLADRVGRLATIRLGYAVALVGAIAIATAPTAAIAVSGTGLIGVGIFLPFASHITLSHSYLPRRIGMASGISIGVTSAIGGLMSAGLGRLADASGLRIVFVILAAALAVGIAIGFGLQDPDSVETAHPDRTVLVTIADTEL